MKSSKMIIFAMFRLWIAPLAMLVWMFSGMPATVHFV